MPKDKPKPTIVKLEPLKVSGQVVSEKKETK